VPDDATRTAAPPRPTASSRLKPRGSSQGGLRQYNERVVLQAIRLNGALAGAEIARVTHLTAQTVSMIAKRLIDDGLLIKGTPVRGKVGQPSVPLTLDPDGAFAIGIKVGRRDMDILLVDFVGAVRARWTVAYDFPKPEALLAEVALRLVEIDRYLGKTRRDLIQGIGIAAPLDIGGWQTLLGFDAGLAERWNRIDLGAEVGSLTRLPVTLLKDTAAACMAELVAGKGRNLRSFLYIFVDTFIGGGLVLDSHLHGGLSGNAGAVGSLPTRSALVKPDQRPPPQLLSVASLLSLEGLYAEAGLSVDAAADARALSAPWLPVTSRWLAQAGDAIALAAINAACLLDIDAVVVDGSCGRELMAALLADADARMADYCWEGANRPQVQAGTIGSDARAIGGALLPLYANFAPDRDLFLKISAQ
jgi:predicted NBD/HSP70 family sugar kinase